MAKKPPPQFAETRLDQRLKRVEGQLQGLGDLSKAITTFKAHPWKTTWPILAILGPILIGIGYHVYNLNNQIVAHVAIESTKLDKVEKDLGDSTSNIKDLSNKIDNSNDKQLKKIDETKAMVADLRTSDAAQTVLLTQVKSDTEATRKDISSILESLVELSKRPKDRPIKEANADDSMQMKLFVETFKSIQEQFITQLSVRTVAVELTRDDVKVTSGDKPEQIAFLVKSSYDKHDLATQLRDIKPGTKGHVLFDDKPPFDVSGLVGIAVYDPPMRIEIVALTPAAKDRCQVLLKSLTDEGTPHVKITVSFPIRPSK